jgi:5,10-methylenetetrahydromethanopterin reductase
MGVYDTPNYLSDTLRFVKFIEAKRFDQVWVGDSQLIHRDAYTDLTRWALNTTKIKIGPLVTNPATRHPSVTASAICSIDEISDGRALLAIGTGETAVRRVGIKTRPVAELEEAVNVIRELCLGHDVDFGTTKMGIRWNREGRHIPIYVTGSGPKVLELAGKVGDGAIINTGASRDTVASSIGVVKGGMERAGRDPKEVDIALFLFTSVSDERKAAINEAKPFATWFFVNLPNHPVVAKQSISSEARTAFDEYRAKYYKYDEEVSHHAPKWDSASSKASFLDDETVLKFVLAGTPEDAVRQIKELEKLGVESFIFRVAYSDHFEKQLALIGDHILAEFR